MSIFFSAWQLVIRRSLANWKLLSSIIIGVFVAVALLSSTPLYSNALNDLGLSHTLHQKPIEMLDLNVYAPNYTINEEEYRQGAAYIDQQISRNVAAHIHNEEISIKSQTFYAGWAGQPIPTGPDRPKGHFLVYSSLEDHVTFLEGEYPSSFYVTDEQLVDIFNPETESTFEIEAMIHPEVAQFFKVGVGDKLVLISSYQVQSEIQLVVKVTGLIEATDPEEEYWFLNPDVFAPESDEGMTAPLFIPEQTLFGVIGRMFPGARATYNWYYYIDLTTINTDNAESVASAIRKAERQIITNLPRSSTFTSIGGVISDYLQKQMFTQIPLFLLVFQIVGIVLYYVVTVANMVIEQQAAEIALLRSRGASTWQIFSIFFMEGFLISAFGGAVGPFLGATVFSLLGKTAPFAPLTGGEYLPIRLSTSVFALAAVAAGLCLIAFLVPAIQASRRGVVHHRQMAARPPRAPFWQRYYLDIVLLAIGGALYYELQQQGSLLTQNIFGGMEVDPLLIITPMLFMIAVAIVFLRLFPLIVSLAAKLGKYITNSPAILSLRYMARNPIHYGRLILLLMMAASVGMFSASFLGTLERSYEERAMYMAGTDIRLEALSDWRTGKEAIIEKYSQVEGVEDVSTAYRGTITVGTLFTQIDSNILAIDPENFEQVAWFRDDFSDKSLSAIMEILTEDKPIEEGIALPDGTETIGLWVHPIEEPTDQVTVFFRVRDGKGSYFDGELGSPDAEGWKYLETNIFEISQYFTPVYPLTLQGIYAKIVGNWMYQPEGLYFDDLQVGGSSLAGKTVIEDFENVDEWTVVTGDASGWGGSKGNEPKDTFSRSINEVYSGQASAQYRFATTRNNRYSGVYPNLDTRPVSVIASPSFLSQTGTSVGKQLNARMPGQFIPVVIKDVVDYFPTLDPDEKPFVIVNIDRASGIRNLLLGGASYFYPNEVWLNVTEDEAQRQTLLDTLDHGRYRAQRTYDSKEIIAKQEADPLVAAGWGGVLLISFIAVILVSGLGFVVYAYLSARGRQLEFAILRTLGFSKRQIIGLISFEQIFIIGSGMGIGTFIGQRLSMIMMPFLQLTERGEKVLPPFVIVTDWVTIGTAYIILSVAFMITIAMVVLFFSRVALHKALRMGDE